MGGTLDSNTLISVYDAACNPARWLAVVEGMAEIVDSSGCILFLSENCASSPWTISAASALWRNLPSQTIEKYQKQYGHHEAAAFAWLLRKPVFTLACSSDPDPELYAPLERGDIAYLLEHAGVQHRAAMRLNDNLAWMDSLAFQFDKSHEAVPANQIERVRPYLPHLSKTLEFSRLYGRLHRAHQAVLAALDNVRVGMAVVTATREIIVANTAATTLLDAGNGVRRDAFGRLASTDDAVNTALVETCSRHADTARGDAEEHTAMLIAPRNGNQGPLLLEVTPLRDGLHEIERGLAAAMVMIIDPQAHDSINISPLARLYDLTDAESDVCRYLVHGMSNPQIAERRGTHPDTVKSQIAQIYQKTSVANRTDLVRLAVRTYPPVDSSCA